MSALEQNKPKPQEVLSEAVQNAAKAFGMTKDELGQVIGRDRTSIKRGIDPYSKTGELALMLVRCYRSLSALMGGGEAEITHWFTTPNRHVGGIPKEVAKSVVGLSNITQYLDAIRGKV